MHNSLDQAKAIVECKTCPWNRFCIEPPAMTEEEVRERLEEIEKEAGKRGKDSMFYMLISTMVFGHRDKECPACPVFIQRLRASPKLVQEIREIMQSWED